METKKLINLKATFLRVSSGEATERDIEIINNMPEETFYSKLQEYGMKDPEEANSLLDIFIEQLEESEEEDLIDFEESRSVETNYSQEVIVQCDNVDKIRKFAEEKGKVRRFLKKQRIKK